MVEFEYVTPSSLEAALQVLGDASHPAMALLSWLTYVISIRLRIFVLMIIALLLERERPWHR